MLRNCSIGLSRDWAVRATGTGMLYESCRYKLRPTPYVEHKYKMDAWSYTLIELLLPPERVSA